MSEAADRGAFPAPGRMVDVGGHRLHLYCTGSGSPTVVIDAGLGDWSTSWVWVQQGIEQTTRVCTYDRAGYGWSEAGPEPRTSQRFADELHTLLQSADVPGPYLMVGHSLGGLTARLFAAGHVADTLGLVLIESMNPGSAPATLTAPSEPAISAEALVPMSARLGLWRILAQPLGLVPNLPPGASGAYAAASVRPSYFETFVDEARGIAEGMGQAAAVRSLGDLPVVVLSRGRDAASEVLWAAQQTDLLTLSSRSQQQMALKSGHDVERDEPEAAIAAINGLVAQIRQERGYSPP